MIPVFISRPNPFTDEQEYFLKKITEKFIVFKFSGVTLEAADYNIYDSLSCLDELLLSHSDRVIFKTEPQRKELSIKQPFGNLPKNRSIIPGSPVHFATSKGHWEYIIVCRCLFSNRIM